MQLASDRNRSASFSPPPKEKKKPLGRPLQREGRLRIRKAGWITTAHSAEQLL